VGGLAKAQIAGIMMGKDSIFFVPKEWLNKNWKLKK